MTYLQSKDLEVKKEDKVNAHTIYVGNFRAGLREGFGQLRTVKGSLYAGTFSADQNYGDFIEGTITTPKGIRYKGPAVNWGPSVGLIEYPSSGLSYQGK